MAEKKIGFSILEGVIKALAIVAVCYAIYHFATLAYAYGYQIYNQKPVSEGEGIYVHVTIPDDAGTSEIARILKRAGVIEDTRLFVMQERLSAHHGKLQAGEYDLSTAMTPDEIMAIMAQNAPAEEEEKEPVIDATPYDPSEEAVEEFADEIMEEIPQEEDANE